jgi:hypothetical protein
MILFDSTELDAIERASVLTPAEKDSLFAITEDSHFSTGCARDNPTLIPTRPQSDGAVPNDGRQGDVLFDFNT